MTESRYHNIYETALNALYLMNRYGSVQLNKLAKVSIPETKELQKLNPDILPYTRCFDYEEWEYKEDACKPARARHPMIREIWVGMRTLGALGDNGDMSEGMAESTMEQEDQAELTDLVTMTYDRKKDFDLWLKQQKKNLSKPAFKKLLKRLPKDKYDNDTLIPAMREDEQTGELIPIMFGDIIQTAWGSNENLDALYMEEAADPRSESDSLMRELTREIIRPNTYMEDQMMEPSWLGYKLPKEQNHGMNELKKWQVAHAMADTYVALKEANGETPEQTLRELYDMAFHAITRADGPVKFDQDGKLISGQFMNRRDYWDEIETNLRSLEGRHETPLQTKEWRQFCIEHEATSDARLTKLEARA